MSLRPYQEEMKRKVYEAWDAGASNVLLRLPTGMGKTRTFCNIAEEQAMRFHLPTAIQVHRKELVQQISLTLAEQGIRHNIIAPLPVVKGIVAAQRKEFNRQFYDYAAPISVVSVDTLIARLEKHHAAWAKTIRLWITDEATHVLAKNKWGKAISYFPNAKGLGVTATPQRLDRRGLGRHADGVFDVMVSGPDSRWGIEHGFLSTYKIAVPASDYRKFLKVTSGDSDYTHQAMAAAASQSHIVGDVVQEYKKHANGKQAIVFASDIGSATKMEREFIENGITAKLLTGLTPDAERLDALIAYRQCKTQVLINVDLFDEGLDVPGIECVIMARPTKSLGKYLQMIGRGLRPAKNKPYCIIIDHVGNVEEHGLPDSHRRWTLDRIVRRGSKVNLIRICGNPICNSPYDRTLSECPWCGVQPVLSGGGGSGSGSGESGAVRLKQVDGDLELLDRETLAAMFDKSILEDPAVVANRVAKAAGPAAAQKALKDQRQRIETQALLYETIALWSGQVRGNMTDRQLNKYFYLHFGMTVTEMASEKNAEMLHSIDIIKGHLV